MSVTQLTSGESGLNCRWSLLGATMLVSPLRARGATVPNLRFYSGTLHQSPDPVHPALLSGITQIKMDLAITIDAAKLKPELFDLPG